MTRGLLGVGAVIALLFGFGCGAPTSGSTPSASSSTRSGPSSTPMPSASTSARGTAAPSDPPPNDRTCTKDEDCAVSRIEASGPEVCCPICGAIAGNRRWHAALKLFCGSRPMSDCRAMDCPVQPRRAVCKAGLCDSEPSTDGKLMDKHDCLPAMRCDSWAGCAAITGNDQDGWFVRQADQAKPGELVSVEQVCNKADTKCTAARVHSVGVACPPHTIVPLIEPPPYTCGEKDGRCVATPRP